MDKIESEILEKYAAEKQITEKQITEKQIIEKQIIENQIIEKQIIENCTEITLKSISLIPRRIESPSSMNTLKKCPRKYYYNYIAKLPTAPNINQTRGKIVHSVAERFFDMPIEGVSWNTADNLFRFRVQQLLLEEWTKAQAEITSLVSSNDARISLFEETLMMLLDWTVKISSKLSSFKKADETISAEQAFVLLRPIREQEFISNNWWVRGFIDAIERSADGKIRIVDYKTNANQDFDEHLLQLSVYALLYFEKHGILPDETGISFMRGEEVFIPVNQSLVESAKREILEIHKQTQHSNKESYPMKPSRLCKWSTGKCDFYDLCFANKNEEEYSKEIRHTSSYGERKKK